MESWKRNLLNLTFRITAEPFLVAPAHDTGSDDVYLTGFTFQRTLHSPSIHEALGSIPLLQTKQNKLYSESHAS